VEPSVASTVVATDIQTCYRHGDRRAGVRCQRCDRPICPSCMRQASVGFHCPECTRSGRQRVMTAGSLATRPVVTVALVAANLAIFGADVIATGRLANSLGEWGAEGALYGPAVAAGDWWRPITAGFLHVGLWHVGFNMFLLWQLGGLLEPALKRWGFSALYVMSLLGGSFLTLLIDPDRPAVGASGAVFGLMGAAFVALRSRGIDPFSTGIGPLIVINLLFTFLIPGISIGGHIGGLVAGAVGGWILWAWGPRLGRGSPLPVATCVALAGALYAGCLLVA
jgi:membrane associated rhomboid family serine protease